MAWKDTVWNFSRQGAPGGAMKGGVEGTAHLQGTTRRYPSLGQLPGFSTAAASPAMTSCQGSCSWRSSSHPSAEAASGGGLELFRSDGSTAVAMPQGGR